MIGTLDISNILYRDIKEFVYVYDIHPHGADPDADMPGGLSSIGIAGPPARINIHVGRLQTGAHWSKAFVEVHFVTPDPVKGEAAGVFLNNWELLLRKNLDHRTGVYEDQRKFSKTRYRYRVDSIGMEADPDQGTHYINVRILFEVLNVINEKS